MPQPKDGNTLNPIEPIEPDGPAYADNANPGIAAKEKSVQIREKKGKYGSKTIKNHKSNAKKTESENKNSGIESHDEQNNTNSADKKTWIEIELLDEDNEGISGEKFTVELPDGSIACGTLDHKGFARIENIDSGVCKVNFPNLDLDSWEKS